VALPAAATAWRPMAVYVARRSFVCSYLGIAWLVELGWPEPGREPECVLVIEAARQRAAPAGVP